MTATPPPPAATPAPAKKPGGLIRWGMLFFIVVVVALFAFVGAAPVTKWAVQKYGTAALGSEVQIDDVDVALFKLEWTFEGFKQKTSDGKGDQFTADEIHAKVSALSLLTGHYVVDEMRVKNPRGRLVRTADGTINGQPPDPQAPAPGEPGYDEWVEKARKTAKDRDLVEDFKKMMEWMKERREKKKAEAEEARKKQEKFGIQDFEGRAEWVRESRPLLVVRHLVAEGMQFDVNDEASGAPPQGITEGRVEVKEWSTSPDTHDKPMEIDVKAKLANAPGSEFKMNGLVDVRDENAVSNLRTFISNLPLEPLDAYWRDSLPVKFVGASIGTLDLPLEFRGWNIDWKPAILLDKIHAQARNPGEKVAGQFDSTKVAQELTNAGKLLLDSIRIHGPIWAPKVEGDVEAVKQLVIQGGKAYALKQGQKLLDEQLQKNPELQKAKAELEKSPAGDVIKGAEKGIGETGKGVLDKAGDFFGGKKK